MNLTFTTQSVDISVALSALQHYRAGEFQQAITSLLIVLDSEPRNWQARLMLAACYYKTNQMFAAVRAFRFIYESAGDDELRKKALEGLQATNAKLERKTVECPAEFGAYVQRNTSNVPVAAWLD